MSSEDRLRSHHFPPEFDMRNHDVVAQTRGKKVGENSQRNEEIELENDFERGKERLKNDLMYGELSSKMRCTLHPVAKRT